MRQQSLGEVVVLILYSSAKFLSEFNSGKKYFFLNWSVFAEIIVKIKVVCFLRHGIGELFTPQKISGSSSSLPEQCDRSFAVAGPHIWNSLPADLHLVDNCLL